MNKTLLRFTCWVIFLPALVSCNIYSPFATDSSDEDHRELANVYRQNGNYASAILEDQKLSIAAEQNQMLCTDYISEVGLTLDAVINILGNQSTLPLGDLAQALAPWTSAKAQAMAAASTACNNYQASAGSGNVGLFLLAAYYITDCGLRVAHTASAVATSDADVSCSTTPPDPGQVAQVNVSAFGTGLSAGTISSSNPGMCPADVTTCATDITTASNKVSSNPQLSAVAGLIQNILNAGLGSAGTDAIRAGIRKLISQ